MDIKDDLNMFSMSNIYNSYYLLII